jgi:molybdopterin-guanine dinucleotide biosynthesis protein B
MIVSFVGPSGIGKTTLICGIVTLLKREGYRVAVMKHTYKRFSFSDFDKRGKDTYRFCEVGSDYVGLVSEDFFFLEGSRTSEIMRLAENLDVDFVIVEGFKEEESLPKIIITESGEELGEAKGEILCVVSASLPNAIRPEEAEKILSILVNHKD